MHKMQSGYLLQSIYKFNNENNALLMLVKLMHFLNQVNHLRQDRVPHFLIKQHYSVGVYVLQLC